MKLHELKYITPEIIYKGGINVSSPEMLDEARRYNMSMVKNAATRHRVNTITGVWIVLQIPFILIAVCGWLTAAQISYSLVTYARLGAMFIGLLAYLGLFGYYIIFRGMREPKMMLLCTLPALATTPTAIGVLILNVLAGLICVKTDEKLSDEAGYPAFVRLNVTTIDSDSESIHKLTYDSIKERAKQRRPDDDQFL